MNRRFSYFYLFSSLVLALILAAVRPLRSTAIYQIIGLIQFAAMAVAAWSLGARSLTSEDQNRRLLALSGVFLVTPFALVALLWVGLGPPWEATPQENQMRYLVLSGMAIAIASGFIILKEAASQAGERSNSAIAFAAAVLAGPLYLVWDVFMFAISTARTHGGELSPTFLTLDTMFDTILFLSGALTYIAAAAFAASLGRLKWIGRGAARAFVIVSLLAFLLLALRGLHFPDPKALSAPWYTSPGFIVGIPAVPFIIPFLFGVILLRRAGEAVGGVVE